MCEVKRYHVGDTGLVEGAALGRIDVVLGADFDRVTAEREALQLLLTERDEQLDAQRLRADTAEGALEVANRTLGMFADDLQVAEQRTAELRKTLTDVREALGREYWDKYAGLDETRDILDAALNPNPEVESHE